MSTAATNLRILIAATDPVVRMHLRRLVAGLQGVSAVSTCRSGPLMRDTAMTEQPHVIIVDVEQDVSEDQLREAATLAPRVIAVSQDGRRGAINRTASIELEECSGTLGRALLSALVSATPNRPALPVPAPKATAPIRTLTTRPWPATLVPEILAIGSSTGGPQALSELIRRLGAVGVPIVLTQHMPPTFTGLLADQLAKTGVPAIEASHGMTLMPGRVHIAPGDRHLLIQRMPAGDFQCELDDGPQVNFCRPAVDPMLQSVIRATKGKALAVILTGMGQDGLDGCRALVSSGGAVLAQDEATSVVWGMPGAVASAGLCHAVLPLAGLADTIKSALTQRRRII